MEEVINYNSRNIEDDENELMVIYAYDPNPKPFSSPWIYGIYKDHREGFKKMVEMQHSKKFGYLKWSNQCLELT